VLLSLIIHRALCTVPNRRLEPEGYLLRSSPNQDTYERRALIDLRIGSRQEGSWTIVKVWGEMDLSNASILRIHIMSEVRDGHHNVGIDLSDLDFIDASGLAVLIAGRRMTEEVGGSLTLISPSAQVRKVLHVSGLDRVFAISDSLGYVKDTAQISYSKRPFEAAPAADQPDFA
jgi:anti-sigma B factor antagonist